MSPTARACDLCTDDYQRYNKNRQHEGRAACSSNYVPQFECGVVLLPGETCELYNRLVRAYKGAECDKFDETDISETPH